MNRKHYCQKLLGILVFTCMLYAARGQQWNPDHAIGTVNGVYTFNVTQVPDNIVELHPAILGAGILSYQWEQSTRPLDGFVALSGFTQAGLSFSSPLTQTMYFRRKVTDAQGHFTYSNTIRLERVSMQWENQNYVREHVILKPGISDWVTIDNLPIGDKLQTTSYADGLGRMLQKISRETATPSNPNNIWGDQVQFAAYDQYGKQLKQYLSYSTATESGKFKTNAETEQAQYYSTHYGETSPYASITLDASPLNRLLNMKSSGTSWAAGVGNSIVYGLNTLEDNVQKWSIGYNTGDIPVNEGAYAANELVKTTTIDENGKRITEYTDKSGQLILRKLQSADLPSGAHIGWICVYSIYDDYGRLRYQLQPEAVKYLDANNWSFAGTNGAQVIDEWSFRYEYDDKGRTILKKTPGAKELRMIYDARDRLVFMQDGNQAVKSVPEWSLNLYDALDRIVINALYKTGNTVSQLRTAAENTTGLSTVSISNQIEIPANISIGIRLPYIGIYHATATIEFVPEFSSANDDEFVAEITTGGTTTTSVFTTTVATLNNPVDVSELNNPDVSTILKYRFYDSYTFTGAKNFSNGFTNTQAYTTDGNTIPVTAPSNRTTGMNTGSAIRVLGTNTFINNTLYYDEEGRPLQSLEDNIKKGVDIITSQYHFDGKLLSVHQKHTAIGTDYNGYDILTKNIYDKLGRLTGIQKKIGTNAFKDIATYAYDDMGRLANKRLAPGYTATGKEELEKLAYSYNLHGQINGINKDYALKASGYNKWDHFFGLHLGFDNRDNLFARAELNGQVAGLLWNSQGDDAQRRYDYTYDNAGRLVNAAFTQKQNPTDNWGAGTLDFSVSGANGKIEYDLNGNIRAMLHKGVTAGGGIINIDNLQYTYASYSNRLLKVTDNGNAGTTNGGYGDFKDGVNGSADDYVYDDNGNLVIDLNKNVVSAAGNTAGIVYNHLDKPETIRIGGKGTIKIVYDADGNKLQRSYTPEGGQTKTTSYVNGFVYRESSLQYITFEEGRIRAIQPVATSNSYESLGLSAALQLPGGKQGAMDYYIRDYQENVRVIVTDETHTSSGTATMETTRAGVEEPVFGQTGGANEVSQTRFAKGSIPGNGWQHADIGSSVSKLSKTAGKIGPNSLLKVMAGDELSAATQYFYNTTASNTAGETPENSVIQSLLQALAGNAGAATHLKTGTGAIGTELGNTVPFRDMVAPHASATDNTPKAYLTILFFDERFRFVNEGSTYLRVNSADDNNASLALANVKAPKNGYAYIYVSNESNEPVYFDNFKVAHNRGRIVEENHYYAFGLRIASISSRKLADIGEGAAENKFLYNDKELFDDGDLDWLDYGFRNYDAQTGRFVQIDPLADVSSFVSGYQYAYNDPVANTDLDGLIPITACPGTGGLGMLGGIGNLLGNIGNALGSLGQISHWLNAGNLLGNIGNTAAQNNENGKQASRPGPGRDIQIVDIFILESKWENVYQTHVRGLAKNPDLRQEDGTILLEYDSDKNNNQARRRQARRANNYKNPSNDEMEFHGDEFPYASTKEGGARAFMHAVPASENLGHGGYLGSVVVLHKMKTGDKFRIHLVPKGKTDRKRPVPVLDPQLIPKFRPSPRVPRAAPVLQPRPQQVPNRNIPFPRLRMFPFFFWNPDWERLLAPPKHPWEEGQNLTA